MNEQSATAPMTKPQYDYVVSLVAKKDLSQLAENERAFLTSDKLTQMNKEQASNAIKRLLTLTDKPVAPKPVTPAPEITDLSGLRARIENLEKSQRELERIVRELQGKPAITDQPPLEYGEPDNSAEPDNLAEQQSPVPDAGYYFVIDPTSNPPGKESFFRVSKPDENSRWHGYTFLAIQASDDFYPIKDKTRRDRIYAEILKDPINAMNEYGIRLGRCGVCNRTLTDTDSRLRGIGPICAGKFTPQEDIDLLKEFGFLQDNTDD